MFIPKEINDVVIIRVYVTEDLRKANLPAGHGFWNIDYNAILLDEVLYNQLCKCKSQNEQKDFFDQLHKISLAQLTEYV
jgi:hypothetical protein